MGGGDEVGAGIGVSNKKDSLFSFKYFFNFKEDKFKIIRD